MFQQLPRNYSRSHHHHHFVTQIALFTLCQLLFVIIRGLNVCSYPCSSPIVSHSRLNVISYPLLPCEFPRCSASSYPLLPLLSSHSGSCKQSSWILLDSSQASPPSAYLSDSMLVVTCGLPHHRLLNTIIVGQTPAPFLFLGPNPSPLTDCSHLKPTPSVVLYLKQPLTDCSHLKPTPSVVLYLKQPLTDCSHLKPLASDCSLPQATPNGLFSVNPSPVTVLYLKQPLTDCSHLKPLASDCSLPQATHNDCSVLQTPRQ
jgi:hypothetical protein